MFNHKCLWIFFLIVVMSCSQEEARSAGQGNESAKDVDKEQISKIPEALHVSANQQIIDVSNAKVLPFSNSTLYLLDKKSSTVEVYTEGKIQKIRIEGVVAPLFPDLQDVTIDPLILTQGPVEPDELRVDIDILDISSFLKENSSPPLEVIGLIDSFERAVFTGFAKENKDQYRTFFLSESGVLSMDNSLPDISVKFSSGKYASWGTSYEGGVPWPLIVGSNNSEKTSSYYADLFQIKIPYIYHNNENVIVTGFSRDERGMLLVNEFNPNTESITRRALIAEEDLIHDEKRLRMHGVQIHGDSLIFLLSKGVAVVDLLHPESGSVYYSGFSYLNYRNAGIANGNIVIFDDKSLFFINMATQEVTRYVNDDFPSDFRRLLYLQQ